MKQIFRFCIAITVKAALMMPVLAWSQMIYRCEVDGLAVYQDRPCVAGVPEETLQFPAYEKAGIDMGAGINARVADALEDDRRSRLQGAEARKVQQSLIKLEADYQRQRRHLLDQVAHLSEHAAYRNWQTNAIRKAKYQQKRSALKDEIAHLAQEYRQTRHALTARLKSVKSNAQK